MKMVILDGYTVNPGDINWGPLEKFGDWIIYDRTLPNETHQRCQDAEIIITSKVVLDREIISKLPRLKYIGVIATGYNIVDLQAAKEKDIIVTNVANYSTFSVAQMVFAHVLELTRRIGHHDLSVKRGDWGRCEDFCYWDYPQVELNGKTLGILGCGNIGRNVAKIALAFDMNVISYDNYVDPKDNPNIEFVKLDELFAGSDILSLHCPLTEETKGIINLTNLSKMKKTAFLINTARGPLVNEQDLAEALEKNIIAGAGLDVLEVEPPVKDNPLLTAPNCHITPHIAWASQESRIRLVQMTADNISAFLKGEPINVVN